MGRRNKVIYWIFTVWLALGLVSTGVVQLIRLPEEVEAIRRLGYPVYLLTILGVWKLLGAAAVLIPRLPLLKEWAYAGIFFAMSGATASRIAAGDAVTAMLPSMLLLALAAISWYFRPADRKIQPARA